MVVRMLSDGVCASENARPYTPSATGPAKRPTEMLSRLMMPQLHRFEPSTRKPKKSKLLCARSSSGHEWGGATAEVVVQALHGGLDELRDDEAPDAGAVEGERDADADVADDEREHRAALHGAGAVVAVEQRGGRGAEGLQEKDERVDAEDRSTSEG